MQHSTLLDRMLATGQPRSTMVVARPSNAPEQPRSPEPLSPWVRAALANSLPAKELGR